jgi:uncharacterized membrane protein YheB (UPF0754 family)
MTEDITKRVITDITKDDIVEISKIINKFLANWYNNDEFIEYEEGIPLYLVNRDTNKDIGAFKIDRMVTKDVEDNFKIEVVPFVFEIPVKSVTSIELDKNKASVVFNINKYA